MLLAVAICAVVTVTATGKKNTVLDTVVASGKSLVELNHSPSGGLLLAKLLYDTEYFIVSSLGAEEDGGGALALMSKYTGASSICHFNL